MAYLILSDFTFRNQCSNNYIRKGKMKKKFTLIELLVVIAIIAILASMLLPALSRARETSRRAACTGNLKSIGTGIIMYADSYGGYLPSEEPSLTTTNNDNYIIRSAKWFALGHLFEGKFLPISQSEILYCPGYLAHGATLYGGEKNINTQESNIIAGTCAWANMTYNYRMYYTQSFVKRLVLHKIKGNEILMSDGSSYYTSGKFKGINFAHPAGYNLLYSDGHVKLWNNNPKQVYAAGNNFYKNIVDYFSK